MIGTITINMPLKAYLCKFLTKKYGSVYTVSQKSVVGIYFIELLDKQYRKENTKIQADSSYAFEVPKSIVERNGFDINCVKMKKFETFTHKLFRSSLEDYISTSINSEVVIKRGDKIYKQDILNAMKQFLSRYEITEQELSLDSLYRDYRREQKNKGQNLFIEEDEVEIAS